MHMGCWIRSLFVTKGISPYKSREGVSRGYQRIDHHVMFMSERKCS